VSLVAHARDGALNLQATLSTASATAPPGDLPLPHHPITCASELHFEPDGRFSCEHSSAPPGDTRTQFCLDHSIALLLIELSREL
jgi:hypothetical protein